MSSYYDNELVSHIKKIKIGDVTIISQIDNITELMMENFQFKNGRVCFTEKQNKKYIMSSSSLISCDVISFINELIQENIFELNEKIIYIGDSLTENGYEFYVHDLLKIIPYLMNDIPQHHYFVSDDATKLIYVSFENEIYFGECNLSKAEL